MDKQQTEKDDHPRTITEKGKPSEPLSDRAHEIRRKPGQSQPDDTQDKGNQHDHVGSSIGGSTSRQEWSQQIGKTPKVEGEKGKPVDTDEDFDANDSTSRGGSSSDQLAGLRNRGSRPDSKE